MYQLLKSIFNQMNQSLFSFILIGCFLTALGVDAATIKDIHVRSTTSREISREMVLSNMNLQTGDEFSPEKLSQDIKKLYATHQFEDIEANVEDVGNNQIQLTINVTPKPIIESIQFIGNKRFSSRKLKRKLSQKENEVLDEKFLSKDVQDLYDFYHDKGYTTVIIKQHVELIEGSHNKKIVYDIDEKSRYKTRGLDIIGNIAFSDKQLLKLMETDISFWGYIFPVGFYDEMEFNGDIDKITQAYLNKGYLDFNILKIDRQFDEINNKIYITLYIEEGIQYSVGKTAIANNQRFDSDELKKLISLKAGDIYNRDGERQSNQAITDKYNHFGYIDCYVTTDRKIDKENRSVDLMYNIREGNPYTIRDVNISGNQVTQDHVIRRELRIQPGDLSDSTKIDASRDSLLNLGYFESVDIIPVSTEEADKKDLSIKVSEKLTGQLLFGAGFSSVDNVLGTVEVSQSNFDLTNYPGFRGAGQRFRLRAQVGSTRRDFILSFTEPWLFDRPLRLDYDLWKRETSSNRNYDQDSVGTSVNFTRKMRAPFWRQSFGYRIEDIDIHDIDTRDYSPKFIVEEDGGDLVSAISLGWTRDHRDRLIRTSSGSRISLRGELQSELIGSYTNLYKLSITGDKYVPLFKRSVFKLSAEIGQVNEINGDSPRVFDRYFAGGANSIRGFKERHVGPVDSLDDEPIGGKSLMLASTEFLSPIYEKTIFWAVFVDTGNVWQDEYDWDISDLNVGAGGGLRLFLPIGAIQLDYGWPVRRAYDYLGSGGRFHFNLGYNF